MTRERHIAIVRRMGVDEKTAIAIVNRLLEELEIERAESESSTADVLDDLRRLDEQSRSDLDNLAPPRPVSIETKESSIVVAPRNIPARDESGEIQPVRLSSSPRQTSPVEVGPEQRWSVVDLVAHLESSMPSSVNVVPEGREEPVRLIRKIEVPTGLGLVKVSYSLGVVNQTAASTQNSRAGEVASPMAVDITLSETFTVYDDSQPVSEKMTKITEAARLAFRPRPERIVSRTPVASGSLSFGEGTPHDEV